MPNSAPTHRLIGPLLVLIAATGFAFKAILIKVLYAEFSIDAETLLALRLLFSLPFFLLMAWMAGGGARNLSARDWRNLTALGFIGYYLSSYFDMYPPGHGRLPGGGDGPAAMGGVWRHGDWLKINSATAACVIYGRSDATINRHGLRMGTSELYRAVEALPEVLDALVVDLEYLGRDSYMPLFVVLRPGLNLDSELRQRLQAAIRTALSPRFVPDDIFQVAEVPRTLSGKKQELPIKKLLLGQPIDKVLNRDAMANPACLDWYIAFAQQRLQAAQ